MSTFFGEDQVVNQKKVELGSERSIIFDNTGDPSTEFVKVDAIELRSILSNLINNATESYGNRLGKIFVSTSSNKNRCNISIKDQGSGIPEEYLQRLGNEAITFKGNRDRGVGLLHAKQKLQSWGGNLSIKSELGIGTKVTISIPRYFESKSPQQKRLTIKHQTAEG